MDIVTINDTEYKFKCHTTLDRKFPNSHMPALHLEIAVWRKDRDTWKALRWKDFKNTYVSEKICDYIKNTINGQRTFYWKEGK